MNDPNKVIDVNLSSLLSLKAELLRKQAEVSKAKAAQTTADEFVARRTSTQNIPASTKKKDKQPGSSEENDVKENGAKVYETEDTDLLAKSQRVLQAKSKFYEKMTRSGGKLNSDDHCLVMFNRKKQEQSDVSSSGRGEYIESDVSSSSEDDAGAYVSEPDDDDWVEYIDCLGRTRKCLRQDLEMVKKRDAELAASMPERLDQSKANWMIQKEDNANVEDDDDDLPIGPLPPESVFSDGCSMVSKLDEQRANWERKEKENLDKSEVHYQDVFFDEARQHGVGYYAFSTDEEERKRQQRELEKSREQTVVEQQHRDALRAQREKIIAERVRAAKNRQRARQGLPPLEEVEEAAAPKLTDEEAKLNETKDERKARKRAEKLKRKQERVEIEREQERQQHIRPWDKNKDGVPTSSTHGFAAADEEEWSYKPEREPMSQEEWNEQKRAERKAEFAPIPEQPPAQLRRTNFTSMPPPPPPPPTMMPPTQWFNIPPPPLPTHLQPPLPYSSNSFAPFQSTKREKRDFHRRNCDDVSQDDTAAEETGSFRRGAAIPPPENLDADFTLPSHKKKAKTSSELERSIEAGLRFLRNNCDKGTMSTKSSWSAKADY